MRWWPLRLLSRRRARTGRLQWVRTDRVLENPENVRDPFNRTDFETLKASIGQFGILVPVIVVPEGRRFRLIAGHRRVRAAVELGMPKVPALVRDVRREEITRIALAENEHRLALNRLERVRAFETVAARRPGENPADIATELGLSWEQIQEARALESLPFRVREAVAAGVVGETQAHILAEVRDPEVQIELIDLVAEGNLDAEDARALVDRVLQRRPTYVADAEGHHFHRLSCAFAQLIPRGRRQGFYSPREGKKRGKIACMNCL